MKNRFIIFLFVSLILHFLLLYLTKPKFLLFSSIQNLKIKKKKEITKVKLVEIKPKIKSYKKPKKIEKPKLKSKPKPIIKHKKIKSKTKSKPKLKYSKLKHKSKTKYKISQKTKLKKQKSRKKNKISLKKNKKNIKKTKIKKQEKLDFSLIQKKIALLKKKEEEEKIRQQLKKEAAVFYANRLVSLVQRLWIFPKVIPNSELPYLKIKIKLRVRKDGTIIGEPIIISKSNNKIFNESALRAVKKLYKYKIPLPDIIDDQYIDIILTLTPPNQ